MYNYLYATIVYFSICECMLTMYYIIDVDLAWLGFLTPHRWWTLMNTVYVYVCTYDMYMCIYIYTHIYTCIYSNSVVHKCTICIYIYTLYVYIYIYVHTHHKVYQCTNMYTYDDLFSQIHLLSKFRSRFSAVKPLQVSSVSSVEPETPASDVPWWRASLVEYKGLLRLGVKRTII